MFSIFLTILKILGIFLLTVLGIILVLVMLILFVPIRYRINIHRKIIEDTPVVVKAKITWLLRIISVTFAYPEAAYVRIKVFCFTIFRSDKLKEKPQKASKPKKKNSSRSSDKVKSKENKKVEKSDDERVIEESESTQYKNEQNVTLDQNVQEQKPDKDQEQNTNENQKEKKNRMDFFRKLWSVLKNIKYTISKICDKIKHIIRNIQYYIDIIKSDTFKRAWKVCSVQVFSLLKSILPKKLSGNLLIGTGDPAGTGQVMAVYGMLYPLLGNHIDITPDFEQQIVEGEFFIKGKITVFQVIRTAWIVYFNKDIRYLIKLYRLSES